MKHFSNYVDPNFLGGELYITVDEDRKMTTGILTIEPHCPCCENHEDCDEEEKELEFDNEENKLEFTASVKCRKGDTFDEKTGVELVKMKIVKKYYSFFKQKSRDSIEFLEYCLKEEKRRYEYVNRKLVNVKKALVNNGYSFYGVEPKEEVVETVVEKPVKKRGRKPSTTK